MDEKHGFQRYSNDLNETVYPPCVNNQASRYRSRFAKKVRVDMWVQKSGCYSTIGPPRAYCYEKPQYFLRKWAGFPPVYIDRFAPRNRHAELCCQNRVGAATEERRKRLGLGQSCIPKVDRGERDFIQENALHVIRMPHRRVKRCYKNDNGCHWIDLSDGPHALRPGFGQVPEYLQRRKWELQCEDQVLKREMEAAQLPPNYRLMDHCERSYLINSLKTRWDHLTQEYQHLPAYISDHVDRQKDVLEKQLKEIEGDLRLLNTNGPLLVSRDPGCQSSSEQPLNPAEQQDWATQQQQQERPVNYNP